MSSLFDDLKEGREEAITYEMDEEMSIGELKLVLIDNYTNLMRIKACEKSENEELDYQIEVAKLKLSTLGISDLKVLERK